jgi:thymidylate synthase ThyX
MSIKVEIIADSLNPKGKRLTTFMLEFPRWILAEVNTHRMLSKSVASSRAIPVDKMIQMVIDNPAMPEFWGKNQSGMQSNDELTGTELENAKAAWLIARDRAVETARMLQKTGLHKQYVNRSIETFMYVRAIVTGTDFANFFALRAHKDAQPEFQVLAYKMLDAYNNSQPKQLNDGEWHIPFGDNIDEDRLNEYFATHFRGAYKCKPSLYDELKRKIAAARCARISYYNYEGKDDYNKDIETCDKLFGSVPRHLSPAEHVAQAISTESYIGNFCGFKQMRKFFEDENLYDNRIVKK